MFCLILFGSTRYNNEHQCMGSYFDEILLLILLVIFLIFCTMDGHHKGMLSLFFPQYESHCVKCKVSFGWVISKMGCQENLSAPTESPTVFQVSPIIKFIDSRFLNKVACLLSIQQGLRVLAKEKYWERKGFVKRPFKWLRNSQGSYFRREESRKNISIRF